MSGYGTDHLGSGRCKFHGGSTPNGKVAAAREALNSGTLWFGDPIETTPEQALLGEVHRAAGHVSFLEDFLRKFQGVPTGELLAAIEDPDERSRGVAEIQTARLLYKSEREHLVKCCQVALHAGIEERQVKLAEAQGQLIAAAIRGIAEDLGVADHPDFGKTVRRHLHLVPDTEVA